MNVKAPGYVAYQRTVRVPEGDRVREHVELRPAPPPAKLAATDGSKVASETGVARPTPTLIRQPSTANVATDDAANPSNHRWWLWTLVGVGVLAAAGGTAAWALTRHTCDRAPCTSW
jgi:hypothetical protein